jgi:hypothetical protein
VLGGILCAVYNARAAEQTGLQPPLLTWLVVLTSANVVAAFCSFVGRTIDSPILNLAGPTGSSVAAYVVLGAWSNSLILTRVAGATAVAMAVSLAVFRGDAAIGVQLILFAAILLAASFYARQEWRRSS